MNSNVKATYPGEFNHLNPITKTKIRDRQIEHGSDLKRLSDNAKVAIETARTIADAKHDRVYVCHVDGHNYLANRAQMNLLVKDYGAIKVQTHVVKPSWEDRTQGVEVVS